LLDHLCRENQIDRKKIKLHVLRKSDINAFALPDNHLVFYSGLIESAHSEAEVLGVMGHELAHLEKRHVMKKLAKELGLTAIITMTTGNKGGQTIQQVVKLLSSSAYDRELEREADKTAVE